MFLKPNIPLRRNNKITIWHSHADDNQWMGIIMIWPMSIRSRVDFDLSGDISKPTSCPWTCMNVR